MTEQFERFTLAVCRHVPRATGDEWAEMKAELTAHLEDHCDALRLRGMSEEAAAERAVREMGDPEEIGNGLNATLSPFWGFILRLSTFFAVLLVVACILPGLFQVQILWGNLTARFATADSIGIRTEFQAIASTDCDLRIETKGHVVRVLRYATGTQAGESGVSFWAVTYAKNPMGEGNDSLIASLTVNGARHTRGAGHGSAGVVYSTYFTPVEPGTEAVTLVFDRLGDHFEFELPLDWGDAA